MRQLKYGDVKLTPDQLHGLVLAATGDEEQAQQAAKALSWAQEKARAFAEARARQQR